MPHESKDRRNMVCLEMITGITRITMTFRAICVLGINENFINHITSLSVLSEDMDAAVIIAAEGIYKLIFLLSIIRTILPAMI